jgi:hypothetical protein
MKGRDMRIEIRRNCFVCVIRRKYCNELHKLLSLMMDELKAWLLW